MAFNLKSTYNNIFKANEGKKYQDKVDRLKQSYNPFLDKNGNLFNPYVDYQKLLNSRAVTSKAKQFISEATGLTPTVSYEDYIDTTVYPQTATQTNVQSNTQPSGNSFVDTAKKYLGTPYVWGGTSPKGFDCSGLMQYVYGQNGISIPRTAAQQYKSGTAVSKENLQPGDLVFFKGYKNSEVNPGHVGMYVGNGQYIQAPEVGDVVKISNLSGRNDYVGARRYA